MNYVYCNDLQNYPVLGTFLELLFHLKSKNAEPVTPIVVVGERDAIKIPILKKLLSEKLGINNGIFKVNNETNTHEILSKKSSELLNNVFNIQDLKLITYKEINIGTGIASSIISKHRCLEPDISNIREDINSYTLQSILFLDSFYEIAHKNFTKNDKVYIYNGRFYNTYPQTILCEKFDCNIMYYERMNSSKNLRMHATRIHDVHSTSRIIKKFWETATDPNKKKMENFSLKKICIINSLLNFQKK